MENKMENYHLQQHQNYYIHTLLVGVIATTKITGIIY
jgi:hypothetical protein